MMATRSNLSMSQHTGTGFYATSLCRSDVRPKRTPLERSISKDKIRHQKRKSSLILNPASTMAIREALGFSVSHTEQKINNNNNNNNNNNMPFFTLPQEILSQILAYLGPADIAHIGQTCRTAHNFIIPENTLLWRNAFLQVFDDPQDAWSSLTKSIRPRHIVNVEQRWDWHSQLKRRCLALKAIDPKTTGDFNQKEFTGEDVAQTLLEIIDTAKTRLTDSEIARGAVPQIDDRSSLNIKLLSTTNDTWARLENLIHDSHSPVVAEELDFTSYSTGRPVTRSVTLQKRRGSRTEAQSRLHVLYGRTAREKLEHGSKGYARRIVYDWNHATEDNEFGPFQPDRSGRINWRVLEATMSVIMRNFEMCIDDHNVSVPPGFNSSIPYRTLADPTVPEDWAGVSGVWLGTYSFLDYADLFHFNTWNDVATIPTLEDVPEACGDLMRLDLKLDSSLKSDPKLQTTLPGCDDLPPLYFSGGSRSYDQFGHPRMLIGFKGRVSLCPGGKEVRWKYIISYRGQDQWQLEGVQPGGLRSGSVYGTWTQWGHEEHAPVGSFMYVREELCKKASSPRPTSRDFS